MNFLSSLAKKVSNEFTNPESHLRSGIGKVTNEFTNPDSHLRNGRVSSGIAVKNDTEIPLLVICSQVTPLHWGKVMPGEIWNQDNKVNMGVVWFTVSVSHYDEKNVPTAGAVTATIVALAATTIFLAPSSLVLGSAMAALGIMSIRGVSKYGVYANGKTLFVNGAVAPDGAYALKFADTGLPDDPPPPPGTYLPPPFEGEGYNPYTGAAGGGGPAPAATSKHTVGGAAAM